MNLELVSLGVFVLSMSYLLWRTARQIAVQRRSYKDLPFGIEEDIDNRASACMLGVAIGDALGMPRESIPAWLARLRFGRKPALSRGIVRFMRRPGTISDDTQLTVATARAIVDGKYDHSKFIDELMKWTHHPIGPGRATMQAARGHVRGVDARDPDSQGNGAAMRVVPLALAFDDLDEMLAAVRKNAAATHPNSEAIAAAESIARLVRYALGPEDTTRDWAAVASPLVTSEDLDAWNSKLADALSADSLDEVGTSGWAIETVAAVVYLLERHETRVEDALTELFAAGQDVDSIAALYCACAGALGGIDVFDRAWLDVQGAAELISHARRLRLVG